MSQLPFELSLALRYLRPKRTFVSIITLISIVGVMLGVAVLIIVISVMSGFDRQLREKILGFNSHLKVYRPHNTLKDYALVSSLIASNQQVRSVSPLVIGPVMVKTQPEEGNSTFGTPYLRGVDPNEREDDKLLRTNIVSGKFDLSGNGLLIGRELARILSVRVGDRVSIFSPRALEKMQKELDKPSKERTKESTTVALPDEYVVKGIFDVGYYEYNATVVICSLANAQDLYDLDNSVHALMVMLHDPFQADEVQSQLSAALGGDYVVSTWTDENSQMLDALLVEKRVMLYLLFFIVIVAAFGITSALITFVVQKTREIGILKALGASSGQVVWIFLSQSVLVGVMGVAAGFGLGMLAVIYRNDFLYFMRKVTGFELFPASIYNFDQLPALIVPGDIAVICGGSLLICILAGLLPAWNAGRLKPVEALRHD